MAPEVTVDHGMRRQKSLGLIGRFEPLHLSCRTMRILGTIVHVPARPMTHIGQDRGVEVDHSSLNRWVIKYVPLLDQAFRARKRRVGGSWRMDETYVRIGGRWKYLYRAVDKAGSTVDFLLTAKRDRKAALRFLYKAIDQHSTPAKITIDGSDANAAAIEDYNEEHDAEVEIRQVKYLNNIVEQDHRAIKRRVRPMLGFKSFWSAAATLASIELMHMIRKGQMKATGRLRRAQQFVMPCHHALAAALRAYIDAAGIAEDSGR